MGYAAFADILKQVMGLDAVSIGAAAIEHAVLARMSACKLNDMTVYLALVRTSPSELQALIEAVVVPETWFFRDREAFSALAGMATEQWLPSHADGVMRLLSLPCASGEEPYSMAMALLGAGVPARRFQIDAVDISAQVLTHARRAVYGKNAFRGEHLDFRERYFAATAHGHHLDDAVRQPVLFHHANLLAPDFLPGEERYDIIFCRNLLIYFDRVTQDTAVRVLQRLLKATGVLFVGPSETGLLLSHDFVSAKVPLAFAFRKIDAAARAIWGPAKVHPASHSSTRLLPALPKASPSKQRPGLGQALAAPRPDAPQAPLVKPESGMAEASALADQGRLAEAEKSCAEQMRRQGPSPEGFYLLGLIRDVGGNLSEAGQHYRKALYLDPNHLASLSHLAFLLEKQGDAKGAQVLRDRLLRAAPK